jgi:putative SOS response-associated peptidase YedK
MSILNTGGLTVEQAEALFNLANNGVPARIDERGQRCEDLYQWGLHPHTAETSTQSHKTLALRHHSVSRGRSGRRHRCLTTPCVGAGSSKIGHVQLNSVEGGRHQS